MFSSVSHEFRTPLNAFSNAITLLELNLSSLRNLNLQSQIIDEGASHGLTQYCTASDKYLKIGKISSRLLLGLTEDILDLAKMEAGTFTLNLGPFTIGDLVDDMHYLFKEQCTYKGLAFIVDAPVALMRQKFVSDEGRVKQVLMNLISNAFKFTHQGHIRLAVSLQMINDEQGRQCRSLKFEVSDTGLGIAQEDTKHLFKMFGVINKHINGINSKGTGLGLTISKKLTENLGGKISLESEEEKGTTIKFNVLENPDESGKQNSIII